MTISAKLHTSLPQQVTKACIVRKKCFVVRQWRIMVHTKNWNLFSRTFQGPNLFFKDPSCYLFNTMNYSVQTKLATIYTCMVKTALSRHYAAKQMPTQHFNSVISSQLHVAWKSISTHTHNLWSIWCRLTFWLVFFFYTILCSFFFFFFFYF